MVLSTGTGFIRKSPRGNWYLVTNRHNVTGRHQTTGDCLSKTLAVPNEIAIFHHVGGEDQDWSERVEPLYRDDVPLWKEILPWGLALTL